jgi:hypothetical protein
MNRLANPRQSDSRAARQGRASAPIRPIAISHSLEVMKTVGRGASFRRPRDIKRLEVGDVLRFIASHNGVRA